MNTFHLYLYGPNCGPIETTFDDASERLSNLDRLAFEADGSFVWTPTRGEQVFGMLYDAADRLQYVELRGQCNLACWQTLIQAVRGDCKHEMAVMSLPGRQLHDLQDFENSAFC